MYEDRERAKPHYVGDQFRELEIGAFFVLFDTESQKHQTYAKIAEGAALNLRSHRIEKIHHAKRCTPARGLEENISLAVFKGEYCLAKPITGGKVLLQFPLILASEIHEKSEVQYIEPENKQEKGLILIKESKKIITKLSHLLETLEILGEE